MRAYSDLYIGKYLQGIVLITSGAALLLASVVFTPS